MSEWTEQDLEAIGDAEELGIASYRKDGTLRPYVTIWVVRTGGGLYVRSAYGSTNPWFARAQVSGAGRVRAGGIEREVTFAGADPGLAQAIDAVYHSKYDHFGPRIVGAVVGEKVVDVTIRLESRESD